MREPVLVPTEAVGHGRVVVMSPQSGLQTPRPALAMGASHVFNVL